MRITDPSQLTKNDALYIVRLHRSWDVKSEYGSPRGSIEKVIFNRIEDEEWMHLTKCMISHKIMYGGEVVEDESRWTPTTTKTSLKDANIIPNAYNNHAVFTTLDEAKDYVKLCYELFPVPELRNAVDEILDAPVEKLAELLDEMDDGNGNLTHSAFPGQVVQADEEAHDEPNILAIHDSGNNGLRTNPELIFEETIEPITPPEGEVDATVPNMMVVA